MDQRNPDDLSYFRFTGPQQRDRAFQTLLGILEGCAIDKDLSPDEIAELRGWANNHRTLDTNQTFREILEAIDKSTADGRIDSEEFDDLRWLCATASSASPYYNVATREIQHLQGMLHGIIADQKVTIEELDGLSAWIDSHSYLKGNFPFDEIESIVTSIVRDRKIVESEHAVLVAFFGQFTNPSTEAKIRATRAAPAVPAIHITGVCAMCPDIEFVGREFCFTGFSSRGNRSRFADAVTDKGGVFSPRVTQSLNYLIVGADGNPCWAFACYGRKVEQAIQHRKRGLPLVIVHENDFWDAV